MTITVKKKESKNLLKIGETYNYVDEDGEIEKVIVLATKDDDILVHDAETKYDPKNRDDNVFAFWVDRDSLSKKCPTCGH